VPLTVKLSNIFNVIDANDDINAINVILISLQRYCIESWNRNTVVRCRVKAIKMTKELDY
jgi:hypothetical protein